MIRSELKNKAKQLMKGNVFKLFGVMLLVLFITSVIDKIPNLFGIETTKTITTNYEYYHLSTTTPTPVGYIWNLVVGLVSLALNIGLCNYFLKFIREENPTISNIFDTIKSKIQIIIPTGILTFVFISLGFACLIIPGIIVSLMLSQVAYIIADENNLTPMEIIKKSADMMNGHKWEYLILILSFFCWYILCLFIIPLIYVLPYVNLVEALYYEHLKNN